MREFYARYQVNTRVERKFDSGIDPVDTEW